ncbi:MAG: GDSL-type esterase/lipase family protein [Bacteroidales bacterium]|nr:GDSL-type esterase/lipase family protein [Bacteroidales bacterium]
MRKCFFYLILLLVVFSYGCTQEDVISNEQQQLSFHIAEGKTIKRIEMKSEGLQIVFSDNRCVPLSNRRTLLLTIGTDGNWCLNGVIGSIPSGSTDSTMAAIPTITIGNNGNWFLNGTDSGVQVPKAEEESVSAYPVVKAVVHQKNSYTFCFSDGTYRSTVATGSLGTIVSFGDSVTDWGNYPGQIAAQTGSKVYKIGFSGCRMGEHQQAAYNELSMYKIAEAIATGDYSKMEAATRKIGKDEEVIRLLKTIDFNSVSIVTVFFGTNDFTSEFVRIGSVDDHSPRTIQGGLNLSVERLLAVYPHLKFVFVTPTHRFFGKGHKKDSDRDPNGFGSYLYEYGDAIAAAAQKKGFHCYDLYRLSGLNKGNHSIYFRDEVHLNNLGCRLVGKKIAAFLTDLYSH